MYQLQLTQSYVPAQGGAEPPPCTIGDMVRASAARWPDVPALRELDGQGDFARSWTYAELLRDAERLGRALAHRHAPGTRVTIFAHNCPEWVLMELACGLAGLVLVTANPASTARELHYVLDQSGSAAIYFVTRFRGRALDSLVHAVCDTLPVIRNRILLTDTAALLAGADAGVLPKTRPSDPAQIQYTSGTTGAPKGAVIAQGAMVRNGMGAMKRYGLSAGAAYVLHLPLFHTAGCVILVLGGLGLGATILLPPAFDARQVARLIEQERLRHVIAVPTMLVGIIEAAERDDRDLSSVDYVMSGAAPVAPELGRTVERLFGARLQIVYGQTEFAARITQGWLDDEEEDRLCTVGQPVEHVDLSIRDPASNAVLPVGVPGEICVRGSAMMLGYHDNPAATAAAIDAQGWLHSGDLGTMDARGYVRITGRVKEMIIRGGENVFPAEIEAAMLEHPAIAEVAVVGQPDAKWGETVCCFMRPSGAARPDEAALKAFAGRVLAPFKIPSRWIWVDGWPLTGSGKIQKFRLAQQLEAGAFDLSEV